MENDDSPVVYNEDSNSDNANNGMGWAIDMDYEAVQEQ